MMQGDLQIFQQQISNRKKAANWANLRMSNPIYGELGPSFLTVQIQTKISKKIRINIIKKTLVLYACAMWLNVGVARPGSTA
jgi:hypothetical protein